MITASTAAGFGVVVGLFATGGITLPLRSVAAQTNSITPNMWMGLANTGAAPLASTVTIKTCYTTTATGQLAQTAVCTKSASGLYLPECPAVGQLPVFAKNALDVTTTGTCFNSE